MSVAFTKEESAETAAESMLPDRPVSTAPNLVTPEGLTSLEAMLSASRAAYESAQAIEDVNERRRQGAVPLRDIRYYAERVRTAQVQPPPAGVERVAFGSSVTFRRADGRTQTFKIVGEDEADPRSGSISYVSPVAAALMGRETGDVVLVGERDMEIISIL